VAGAVSRFPWHRLEPLKQAMDGEGSRAADAADVVNAVRDALARDELVSGIAASLGACEEGIFRWLTQPSPPPDPKPVPSRPGEPPKPGERTGRATRAAKVGNGPTLTELTSFLDAHPDDAVEVTWRVVP
jgi:hypothetical protein